MSSEAAGTTNSKAMTAAGWVLTLLPVALLVMSATFKLTQNEQAVEGVKHFGYPDGVLVPIGAVEVACTVLYLIPQTAVLGAILLTGYLGGAVATHVSASEAFIQPILVGVFLWGGLFLRDPRVRALMPLRRKASE